MKDRIFYEKQNKPNLVDYCLTKNNENDELKRKIRELEEINKKLLSDFRSACRDSDNVKKAMSVINALEFVLTDPENLDYSETCNPKPENQLSRILNHLANILTRG